MCVCIYVLFQKADQRCFHFAAVAWTDLAVWLVCHQRRPDSVCMALCYLQLTTGIIQIHWNLSIMDNTGPKKKSCVLLEVSLFQRLICTQK